MLTANSLQTALDGLSFRRLFLLLAPGAYSEDERRDPDRNEEDVGHGGEAGREPDRTEEGVRVDDQDEPAYRGTHDTRRQYADDVGRDGAAIRPPRNRAPTIVQGTSARLRPNKKPMLAQTAITNSLVSTVPMILRG